MGAYVRVALDGTDEAAQYRQRGVTLGESLPHEPVPFGERGRPLVHRPSVDPVVGVVHERDGGHDVRHQRGGQQQARGRVLGGREPPHGLTLCGVLPPQPRLPDPGPVQGPLPHAVLPPS